MKRSIVRSLLGRGSLFVYLTSLLAVGSVLGVGQARAQDPKLKPTYGSAMLKAGFTPDPFTKQVVAGGTTKTELGGVKAIISTAPDFRLHYTAGSYALKIYVESKGDTTLLIKLPNGTWVANDDGGAGLNPLLTFAKPQSGQYDIWVGTFGPKTVAATLRISETSAAPKPVEPKPADPDARTVQMRNAINAFRAENGLPALTFNNKLISIAGDYAKVMATMDKMGHSVDGTTVPQRLDKGGYNHSRYFENVAWNQGNADPVAQAVKSWKESTSGHREAMLSREVTEMGIGIATSSTGKVYFCLVLGKPR